MTLHFPAGPTNRPPQFHPIKADTFGSHKQRHHVIRHVLSRHWPGQISASTACLFPLAAFSPFFDYSIIFLRNTHKHAHWFPIAIRRVSRSARVLKLTKSLAKSASKSRSSIFLYGWISVLCRLVLVKSKASVTRGGLQKDWTALKIHIFFFSFSFSFFLNRVRSAWSDTIKPTLHSSILISHNTNRTNTILSDQKLLSELTHL